MSPSRPIQLNLNVIKPKILLAIITILVVAFIAYNVLMNIIPRIFGETFASKREKAETMSKWVKNNHAPTYTDFRAATGGDVIDYTTSIVNGGSPEALELALL
jgi:hypothetical protein